MKQLTQKLKNGNMQVVEVAVPPVQQRHILVRNHFSLISAGTEGNTVKTARKGYLGKAKERPQQLKQVVDTLKTQGVTQTYRAVMKKLEAYSPLGYSSAGEVIDLDPEINSFKVGDLVACGGLTASHAEIVCVPANLCVKLQLDTDLKQASYNTLGAIALQGVRQADLRVGETCAVIGLGLLGQLTGLLLRASGVQTIGIDINPAMVDIAAAHCVDLGLKRDNIGVEEKIIQATQGLGCDAVIITAASSSLDPINFAGAISRKRGTVVVVGAVPTGFEREPHFYKKELQVKMSCSYGPGRYDPVYEDKGIDYPAAYVRWTENRNMQAFQNLIYTKKIDLSYLTTHIFKLDEAPAAYDMLMTKSEPFIGILIEYDTAKEIKKSTVNTAPQQAAGRRQLATIGFIGAGSYAQSHLLPNIPKQSDIRLKGVMTATSSSSRSVADRYKFEFCTGDEQNILGNNDINTIFIATRHDSHAKFVVKSLQAGKNVFVEKPLCLQEEELHEITNAYNSALNSQHSAQMVMVGYNRRFAPLIQKIKETLGDGPMAMMYRVNAGSIPADSWIQDTEIGGGRIIGEVCHFIDLLTFLNGSLPVSVYATAMQEPQALNDIVNISLSYGNGSIGTIAYFANGDKSVPKEMLEIYANGCTALLNDFKTLSIYNRGRKQEKRQPQDKGQKNEIKLFLEAILNGTGMIIPFDEIYSTSLVTFKIIESIQKRESITIT